MARTERANGQDAYSYHFTTDAQGRPMCRVTNGMSGQTDTLQFADANHARRQVGTLSNTGQGTSQSFDAQGRLQRQLTASGEVVFYTRNARGQETQRATFRAPYLAHTTPPPLGQAVAVVSTQWHATLNLPTQVAEPGKVTAYSYNAQGLVTGQSWSATADATGAAGFVAVRTGRTYSTDWGYNANGQNTSVVERVDGVETQRWALAYDAAGDLISITDVTGAQSATLTNDAFGRLTRLAASNGAVATFAWNADGQMTAATLPGYSASFTYTAQKRLNEVRLNTGEWLRVTYNTKGEPTQVLNSNGQVQTVSGLSRHWLQSDQPLNGMQTLLAHSLEKVPQRIGDLLIKSAIAQVPAPPMPSGLVGGLAAAGGAASRGADDRPAAGACCGGTMPTDREIQERLQRTLPFTLMQGAAGLLDALTQDILTMKGRSDLNKRMQCPTDAYHQPKPPGCWEAHHIVAFADRRADTSRTILRNVGIDINSPANGVWMACDKHRGMHTNDYYTKVNNRLRDTPQEKSSIERELANIRSQLQSGTF